MRPRDRRTPSRPGHSTLSSARRPEAPRRRVRRRIFCGLFDEEIMSKVHFLPASVADVAGAMAWVDKQQLHAFL